MTTKKKPPEAAQGRYFALPHGVLDSAAWVRCSPSARALLLEVCRQHTGANNGALHLARAWVESRGWTRPATVRKLADELLKNRLLVQTRHGGLRNGSHQYALSWLPITNFFGLDLTARDYAKGAYLLPPLMPIADRKTKIGRTPHVLGKASARTPHVLEVKPPRTPHVLKTALSDTSPRTPHVHNEYNHSPPLHSFAALAGAGWILKGWRIPTAGKFLPISVLRYAHPLRA
jgi:hypothetical protein